MTRSLVWTLLVGTGLVVVGCDDRPFVTAVDLPLQIIAVTPGHQATGVARDATVTVVFNLGVVPSSVQDAASFYLEALPEGEPAQRIVATIAYQAASGDDPPQAVLTPEGLLDYSRSYRVTLGTGIRREPDEDQNIPEGHLAVQVQSRFTVVDPPPLQLVGAEPSSGAQDVARDAALTLTFSEPLNCDSLEAGVVVTERFDPHPHTAAADRSVGGTWTCSEPVDPEDTGCAGGQCSAVFTPSQGFSHSSLVRVNLAGGTRVDGAIESFRATASGGQLPQDLELGFWIVDPPPLTPIAISPAAASEQVPLDAVITATFSENLECDSVNSDTVRAVMLRDPLRGGGSVDVTGTLSCSGDAVLGLDPDADFDWSAEIELTLAGGAFAAATYPHDALESARATSQGGQLPAEVTVRFRALDPPALRVLSTNPAAGAADVPVDTNLTIVFSEAVDCLTVAAAISATTLHVSELDDDGSTVAHSVGLSSCADATIVLEPAPDFALSGLVTVTLPATLASLRATSRGGTLDGGFVFSFRVEDPPALRVLSTNPAAGAADVPVDTNLTIVFSEAVDCLTVAAAISATTLHVSELDDDGSTVAHSVGLSSCADATIVLEPAPDFALSGLVTVTLPATLASLRATSRGGTLDGGFVFSFRAEDPARLVVVSTLPGGGSTTADLATDLTITFSEAIDCDSVLAADVGLVETLDDGSVDSGNSATVRSCGGAVLVLELASDLRLSSTVVASLPPEIASLRATSRGGTLEGGYSWVFGTADPPDLTVVYTSPGDGNILVPTDKVIVLRFSEALDPASVGEDSILLDDVTVAGAEVRLCDSAAGQACRFALSDGDTTVTLTPAVDFAFDHRIRFTLTTALRSARATTQGGSLGLELPYTFETTPVPPIEVDTLSPAAGANIPLRPLITVVFNQDVLGSTVVTTGAAATRTVWLNPGTAPDASAAIALTCTGCASTGTTFAFQPGADLVAGASYVFAIKGNIDGIRGASGGAFMIDDYLASYLTSTGTLVSFAAPVDLATGVPVDSPVCVIFLEDIETGTVDSDGFAVSFVNDLGGLSPLQPDLAATTAGFLFDGVDPATGAVSASYLSNRVCFVPGAATYGCRAVPELLPANAEIQVALSDAITSTGGTALSGGYSLHFFTGGLERLDAFAHRNTLGGTGPLAGAREIPINASLVLRFSASVDQATVDAALRLVRLDTGVDVPLGAASLEAGDTVAVVQPSDLLPYLDDLTEGLELRVTGGALGLRTADGRYLQASASTRFVTSPKTLVALSPPQGVDAYTGMTTPAMFSRPMHLPSITTDSFGAFDATDGVPLTAVVATSVDDVDSAVLIPVPAYPIAHQITVTVTTEVRDYLGNPLPQDFSVSYASIRSGAANDSYLPDTFNASSVIPTTGAVVTGAQVFTLTFPNVTARLKNRMLAPSLNDATIGITENACPVGVTPRGALDQANRFVLGAVGQPDKLEFWAESLLRHDCSYEIRLVRNELANVYGFADAGAGDVTFSVTAEHTPPTLQAGTSPAAAASGVSAEVQPVAVFSEAMAPDRFAADSSFTLDDGTPVSGSIVHQGASARFIPDQPLHGGVTYTWTIGSALTDLAGNAFAGATRTFTVETSPPTVGAVTIPSLNELRVPFSEKIDPASVVPDVVGSDGSLQVRAQADGSVVLGCWDLDVAGSIAVFTPLLPLRAAASYEVTVTTDVTDLGGTPLGATEVQIVSAP